jgi:hypothetical protein
MLSISAFVGATTSAPAALTANAIESTNMSAVAQKFTRSIKRQILSGLPAGYRSA